jgi:hypothetical protein
LQWNAHLVDLTLEEPETRDVLVCAPTEDAAIMYANAELATGGVIVLGVSPEGQPAAFVPVVQ